MGMRGGDSTAPQASRAGCIISVLVTWRTMHARYAGRLIFARMVCVATPRKHCTMASKMSETEHDFTLVLTGITGVTEEVENALFEAGCDDATLSVRSGRVYLTFSRVAATLKDAILSAIRDVRKAQIGADVLRVDTSNLVSQADIARRIGRTRQLINQYISGVRGPGGFPPPACAISEGSPLWDWCEVAAWLWENDMIKEDAFRDAESVSVINSVLDLAYQRHNKPELTDEVLQSVGGE